MPLVQVKPLRGPDAKAIVRKLAAQSRGVTDGALNEIGNIGLVDMQGYVNHWGRQPAFKIVRTLNTVSIVTDDRIFRFVNQGVRAHIIRARPGGILVFRSGYSAKTRANNPNFKGSGKSFGPTVVARVVHHPGFVGRGYTRIETNKLNRLGLQIVKHRTKETVSQRNP